MRRDFRLKIQGRSLPVILFRARMALLGMEATVQGKAERRQRREARK